MHGNNSNTVEIDENTVVDETYEMWAWDDDNYVWISMLNYNVSVTWNDALAFDLDEAALAGVTVGLGNEYGSIDWTLILTPNL
jgi:hypothetical protein